MALIREDDGTTALQGLVTNQAALHGLLAKVRDIGAPSFRSGTLTPPIAPAARRSSVSSTVMSAPSTAPVRAT
jgi:hypothetical protein